MDVNISDHSTAISFTDYYDGAAPALLVNHAPSVSITIKQRLAPLAASITPYDTFLMPFHWPQFAFLWVCKISVVFQQSDIYPFTIIVMSLLQWCLKVCVSFLIFMFHRS